MLHPMTIQTATLTDMAQRLNRDFGGKTPLPAAIFITDQQAVPDPEKVIAVLPPGSAVIFRDYDHPARPELGQTLAVLCRDRDIIFLVAGDPDLAIKLAADGVHLPEAMMAQVPDIRQNHPDWMITVACHDLAAVKLAQTLPINAALIAPVFPTHSHPETLSGEKATLGLSGVQNIVEKTDLPLYALGGVTKDTARQLIGSGLAGLAAIRGFDVSSKC